jgi:hypothetical protein
MHWTDRSREVINILDGLLHSLGCNTHSELVEHAKAAANDANWYTVAQAIESLSQVTHGWILKNLSEGDVPYGGL